MRYTEEISWKYISERKDCVTYMFGFFLITTGDNCTLLNRFLPPDENSDKSDLGAQNRIGDNERPQITQRLGDNSNYTVGWI